MIQLAEFSVLAVWVTLAAYGIWGWAAAFMRHRRGMPLIPYQARRPVTWGLLHLIAVFLLWFAAQLAALVVLKSVGAVDAIDKFDLLSDWQHMLVLSISSLASLIATGVAVVFLVRVGNARGHDLGVSLTHWKQDIVLGLTWFPMLVLPVLAIQLLLTQWFETKHPLVELVKANPSSWFMLQGLFAASMVAPIFEEFFVRVFLQGWLENVSELARRHRTTWIPQTLSPLWLGVRPSTAIADVAETKTVEQSTEFVGEVRSNPYSVLGAPTDFATKQQVLGPATELAQPSTWPIFVSAALFAMAHWGHGPDPIPLFVLALGLGFLYQRTHRVLPCIVVHFLLNTFSMLQLWLYVM